MKKIYVITEDNGIYAVEFRDSLGASILARTRNKAYALKLKNRFEMYLKEGRLLPTYKSVYEVK